MNEDLLTTNKIGEDFQEYVTALNRSNNVYDKDKPEFLNKSESRTDFGNIDENSIGYDQFKNLEYKGLNKRKKIQRTVINIDSKNRKKNYTFNEHIINFDDKSRFKLKFYKNSKYFYIITENIYISDIRDRKELIIYNLDESITTDLGIDKQIFDFNRSTGKPIFFVNKFLYNTKDDPKNLGYRNPLDKSNITNKYDINSKQYVFNIIEVQIPSSININEINGLNYNGNVNISFIYDVDISYTSPSHYKLALNRTYSNVYAVRLVSSEIPNTAYSFNGIETSTNVGKNTLRTRVNNRLRWLNKSDLHSFLSFRMSEFKLYDNIKPYSIDNSDKTVFQKHQDILNKRVFNKNIHNLPIRTYSYSNFNIKDMNKKYIENGSFFTTSNINRHYLSNYHQLIIKLLTKYETYNPNIDNNNYKFNFNTLYLDNNKIVDNIFINDEDDDAKITINDDDNIILSVQNNPYENNIYKITKDVLSTFQVINQGSNFLESDITNIRLYKYDHQFSSYSDSGLSDINDKIKVKILNGKIDNIEVTDIIKMDTKHEYANADPVLYNHLDYYYGLRGFFEHTHYIDKSKTGVDYDDNTLYYDIIRYRYNVLNHTNGVIDTSNPVTTTYHIIDDEGYFVAKGESNYTSNAVKDIKDLSLNDFINAMNRLLGSYGGTDDSLYDATDKSTLPVFIEYRKMSDPSSVGVHQSGLNKDKATFTLSKINSNLEFNQAIKEQIENDYANGKKYKFNHYFKVSDFTLRQFNNLYIPGEKCYIFMGFNKTNITGTLTDHREYEFHFKINIKYEMLNMSRLIEAPNLDHKVTVGSGLKARVGISSNYLKLINENTEISRFENTSYLKLKKGEDDYFYIYKSLDGRLSKDNYYLINNDNSYYQFLYTNITRNYERTSSYIRQNQIDINDKIPLTNRDYYSNFNLIGEPNSKGLATYNSQCYEDTASLVSHNIFSQVSRYLDTNNIVLGAISARYNSKDSYVYFSFNDNYNLIISIFSTDNNKDIYDSKLISNMFKNKILPINASMIALEDVIYYNFIITDITKIENSSAGRLKESYLLSIIPESGDFDKNLSYKPFKLIDKSITAFLIIRNPINANNYSRLKLFFPDYVHYIKNYYSEFLIDRYYKNNDNDFIPGNSLISIDTIAEFNTQTNIKNQLCFVPFIMNSDELNGSTLPIFVKYTTILSTSNYYPNNYYYIRFQPAESKRLVTSQDSPIIIKLSNNSYSEIVIPKKYEIKQLIGNDLNRFDNIEVVISNGSNKLFMMFNFDETKKFIGNDGNNIVFYVNSILNTEDNNNVYFNSDYTLNSSTTETIYVTLNFIIKNPKTVSNLFINSELAGSTNESKKIYYTNISKSIISLYNIDKNLNLCSMYELRLILGKYTKNKLFYDFDAGFIKNKSSHIIPNEINKINVDDRVCYVIYRYIKRLYLRLSVNILMNALLINENKNSNNNKILPVVSIIDDDDKKAYLQFVENNLDKKLEKNNFLDVLNYNQYMYSVTQTSDQSIVEEGLYRNYVEVKPVVNSISYVKHTEDSNTISGFQNIGEQYTTTNNQLFEITSYPVYELQIDNAKYNETSLRKYFNKNLSNIHQKIFDYKKGIYVDDINKNTNAELLKISGYNNPTGFDIVFNKSIGSVSIKQYMKIFEVNKKSLDINNKYVFYNNGLPYMYFRIPEVSLPHNSIIQIQGTSSLDNIPATEINGQRKLIVPNKYRVTLRQLAPLPDTSYIDSDKFLFQNHGYSRVEETEINNEYQEYINNAISQTRVKDIANNYINNSIRRIRERVNKNQYFNIENITNMNKIFNIIEKNINSSNQHKFNLSKTYVNNYGENTQYEEVKNFDNLGNISVVTSNKEQFEYYGQALINCSDNGLTYRQTKLLADEKNKLSGIESGFFENELFMRISDINSSYKKTIIGRITHLDKIADRNGNHTIDYDLFVEELNNFRIGDIIIGLDSGAIAVIIPPEYQFTNLPNDDIISLGMANYYFNLNNSNKYDLVNFFLSINNSITNENSFVFDFINKYQFWIPEKINTNVGFYIKLDSTPNNSRLTGILTSRLQVLIPHDFKFLEGSDTPLESLGFVNKIVNNEFSYFKDNFTNVFETEIKWSYLINNNTDVKQYLIVETKNTDNFSIEDEVYIRNHNITLSDVNHRKEVYFNTKEITSFASFISKFEEIYNNIILEKVGNSYFNNMNITDKINVDFNTHVVSINKNNSNYNYFNDDKSSIDSNYLSLNVDNTNDNIDILYYTDDHGSITNILYTDMDNVLHLNNSNSTVTISSGYGNNLTIPLNKLDKFYEKEQQKEYSENNFNFGLNKIPFKNKFLGVNYHQSSKNFIENYNLKYTNNSDFFSQSDGDYFKIIFDELNSDEGTTIGKYYSSISGIYIKNGLNSEINLIDRFKIDGLSNNELSHEYKNQLITLTFTDSNAIKRKFILKEVKNIINNSLKYKLLFISPGTEYYKSFISANENGGFQNDSTYLIELKLERTYTSFSTYDEVNSLGESLDTNNIRIYISGNPIDNVLVDSSGNYTYGTDYTNAQNYINGDDIRLDFIQTSPSITTTISTTDTDNVIINKIDRLDMIDFNDIKSISTNATEELGKHVYLFDITVQNIDLSNLKGDIQLKNPGISGDPNVGNIISSNKYIIKTKYNKIDNSNIEPQSIFNRIIQSYISNISMLPILKSSKLFTKYSNSIFTSRIIKIKLSPIDNKGFSIEKNTLNLNSYQKNSVFGPVRAVPGYNKLLFPYHEFNIIADYTASIDGQNYKVGSEILKRYSRVRQKLDNNSYTSRNFLPGMGIYTVSENIEPGVIIGSTDTQTSPNIGGNIQSYNTLGENESISNTILTNTVYKYKTKFIGYVLNTSIESIEEDAQSYRLNSESFSHGEDKNIKTEYYAYVLIDPSATTNDDIDDIFEELNKDNIHYVYDGSASKDYTKKDPLISPGVLTPSGNKYYVEYKNVGGDDRYFLKNIDGDSNGDSFYRVALNQVTAINDKNIYGTRGIIGSNGSTKLYDDDNLSYFLDQPTYNGNNHDFNIFDVDGTASKKNNYKYIDVLQENFFGCITIIKNRLDKTLPNFTYSKRIACATHTERPVFYKKTNNTMAKNYDKLKDKLAYNEKFFVDGSLDLYFQEYLKNKAVMKYEPILDTSTYKNLNSKNIIIEDNINTNNRINNNYEFNQHNNQLKNYVQKDFDYNNKNVKPKMVDGVEPEYTFEPDTDLVLINNARKGYKYSSGDAGYNSFLGEPGSDSKNDNSFEKIGYSDYPIKVLTGRLLPQIQFDNNISYEFINDYEYLTKNWTLLDKEYDPNLSLLGSHTTFGKYKTNRYDIVGNNYEFYNKTNVNSDDYDLNNNIYNEVMYVEELGNESINNNTSGYLIARYDISQFHRDANGEYISTKTLEDDRKFIRLLQDKLFVLSGYVQDSKGSEPFNLPYNSEVCIIESAQVFNSNTKFSITTINDEFEPQKKEYIFLEKVILFRFHNKILKTHKNHKEEELEYNTQSSKYYIYHQMLKTKSKLEKVTKSTADAYESNIWNILNEANEYDNNTFYRIRLSCSNIKYLMEHECFGTHSETFIFDYGKKRRIEFRDDNPPYSINSNYSEVPTSAFLKSVHISYNKSDTGDKNEIIVYFSNNNDSIIPVFYPENTNVVLLKNTLLQYTDLTENILNDRLPYDNSSTKPFIHNGEWYTKIYFRSADNNDRTIYSSLGKEKYIINNYHKDTAISSHKNIYSTTDMFVHSMKGLRVPFICLDINDNNELEDEYDEPIFIGPIENDHYNTYIKNLINDYSSNKLIQDHSFFEGEFVQSLTSQLEDKNYSWKYIHGKKNINFDYFIVKGLYQGFGGYCEERFDSKYINNSINNDIPARIARIKNLDNKFFLFIELDTYKSPLVFNNDLDIDKTYTINQSGRTDSLDYEIYLNLLENNLSKLDTVTMNRLTKFGKGGSVSKKKIENPYNLNPNNYVYLVIPVFDNIELIQNNSLQGAFAKILLPGESNKTLFNTYTSASKVFTHNLYNNLSEIEIAFITNDGYLFDFNGAEHSFSLEITEVIDKFEHINPKFGNIEF